MKLWNVTSAIAMGALFVFGCSVESGPTTDAGSTTDTGAKTDTGTATTDTGTATTDTGTATGDSGNPCVTCQQTKCATEQEECKKPENNKGCNDLITCINACPDKACADKCVTDSTSTAGKALLQCVIDKCATECTG
jgi:hypothetical protein